MIMKNQIIVTLFTILILLGMTFFIGVLCLPIIIYELFVKDPALHDLFHYYLSIGWAGAICIGVVIVPIAYRIVNEWRK